MTEDRHRLLPGYIFLYSEEKLPLPPRCDGIIHWLRYSDEVF